MNIWIAQMGAREHYAVPKMFFQNGCLARFTTDIWNSFGTCAERVAKLSGSAGLTRLAQRYDDGIPTQLVSQYPSIGLAAWLAYNRSSNREAIYHNFAEYGKRFAERVIRDASIPHDVFIGFSSTALETIKHENSNGILTVLDVIAPVILEEKILDIERKKFPGWEKDGYKIPRIYLDRIREEWEEATRLIVNSAWSRNGLIMEGIPESKIRTVPLAYQVSSKNDISPSYTPKNKIKVLWLGSLSLRKGFQYAIDAARKLGEFPVEFTFVGPSQLNLDSVKFPDNCTYVGAATRGTISNLYNSHDIFLLPTLSDGFAITQVEAMAHGIPVITTERCGDLVEDGVSGWKVPAMDAQAIADTLKNVLDSIENYPVWSSNALSRMKILSLKKVSAQWISATKQ